MQVVQGKCPGCQRVLRIPGKLLGGSMRCKHCGKVFQFRASPAASPPPAPAEVQTAAKLASTRNGPPEPALEIPEVAGPDTGVLPAASNFSPTLSRYRRKSSWGERLTVFAVVLVVMTGLAGGIYYAVTAANSDSFEKNSDKTDVSPVVSKGPAEKKPADLKNENPVANAPGSEGDVPFPRRALFICVSNYLYANPVSYGAKSRTVHEIMDRVTTALHIAPSQRIELSDAAKTDAHPTTKPVIERTMTDFFNSSRAQDRIIMVFTGHAVEIGEDSYLVPLEGELSEKETLIPLKWVYDQLAKCKARQKVLIMDVCRFDPSRGLERPGSGPMGTKLDAALQNPPKGVQVWSACVAGQYSYEGYAFLRPGEVAHTGFFLDEMFEAVGPEQSKRVRLGIARPEDSLPLDFLANGRDKSRGVDRGTQMEVQEVYKAQQTPRLVGIETGSTPYDPKEPLPPAVVIQPPPMPDGSQPADKQLVAEILRQIDVIPPIKESKDGTSYIKPEALPPFSATALEKYRDDPNSPLRKAVENAVKVLTKQQAFLKDEHKGEGDDARIKMQILDYQKKEVAPVESELSDALEDLLKAGENKDKETSKRWQANYEYVLARLKARMAYVHEYNYIFGQIRKDGLPPRDPKIHSGWRLASQEKLQSGAETRKLASDAKKIYENLAKKNKGTPWEILAKRELMTALGLQWQPTR
jgi:hypothetical protein